MSIVKQAAQAFQQGDYRLAKQHYRQAAKRYGEHLFAANITLCERAEARPLTPAIKGGITARAHSHGTLPDGTSAQQLEETQQLLEHYFIRCQELEHRLLDR